MPPSPTASRTFPWWIILALVGLDYFSSLAYLPSLALEHVGKYAPLAALGVIAITLLAALPVYWYVVGRSPHGRGGIGLLESRFSGWSGKLTVLFLLGFLGTDYVLTRSLSTSNAGTHIAFNPYYPDAAGWLADGAQGSLTGWVPARVLAFWNEQLVITVLLTVGGFGLYFWLVTRLTRGFTRTAIGIVGGYVLLNVIVIGSAVMHLIQHPEIVRAWFEGLGYEPSANGGRRVAFGALIIGALWGFPPMMIGLSGFELSAATTPMVEGDPNDDPDHPRGRIRKTRWVMLTATLVMSALILSSITGVTMLVDLDQLRDVTGAVQHRALSHIAHGGRVIGGRPSDEVLAPFFGPVFGTAYDLSSVLILCLAGASATITLRDIVPDFLSRFGMQLGWAQRIGVITHLFNLTILVVTVAFRASVEAQQWAYAASVLALLFGASLAAVLDVRARLNQSMWRWPVQVPFALATTLFAGLGVLLVLQRASGLAIALAFVFVVLVTAIVSRWLRATEPRFEGFDFADEETQVRWAEVCKLEFQVLVPHDPTKGALRDKDQQIRESHRLGEDVPIIFIEVTRGDPSDFAQRPLMRIDRAFGQEVIRVSRATSVAHVLAAIGLAFREVGRPPELHFNWSEQSPMQANLGFLLLGLGNVPWLVRELVRRAERDPARRPRVVVG